MYRALYEVIVAKADDAIVDFNMDVSAYHTGDSTWAAAFWSKTIALVLWDLCGDHTRRDVLYPKIGPSKSSKQRLISVVV